MGEGLRTGVPESPPNQGLPKDAQVVLGVGTLSSGAALITTILTRAPLSLTLAVMFAGLTAVTFLRLRRLSSYARQIVRRRALVGVIAGVSGVLAYDLVRLLIVVILQFHLHPYDTFPIFGQLIIGGDKGTAQWVAGAGYHCLNGTMFAISLCLLLPGRQWLYGLAWALGLETFTLAFYPGWLNLHEIVLQEFTVVSMGGHIAYGTVIGLVNHRLLSARRA
jgi:hypothetical protein